MRSMSSRVASALLLLAVLAAAATSAADVPGTVRHSGTLVTIDPRDGVMVVDEVGPWRVEKGATVTTRRVIGVTPDTKFNLFMRVDVPGAFAGDFIEVELDAGDLTPGDFVTAECVRERGRLVALTVTVAELSGE